MGLFSSSSDADDERLGVEEEYDWESLIASKSDVLFSCTNADNGKDRELFVTENRIVVLVESQGGVFPIDDSVIQVGERGGLFRITLTNGSSGYGLRVSKDDFEQFWRVVSEKFGNT